jgi:hypothetical protein
MAPDTLPGQVPTLFIGGTRHSQRSSQSLDLLSGFGIVRNDRTKRDDE